MLVPTPHNQAKLGDIAKTVLMPGDPLRAKHIADTYLADVICYNQVRGILGYTGYYKGKRISVQASGMGVPSMGIYSKELFEGYDVNTIIRIGTAGTLANPSASEYAKQTDIGDIVVASSVDTDSNYIVSNNWETVSLVASDNLLQKIRTVAAQKDVVVKEGKIFTTDTFYKAKEQLIETSKLNILGVEMETSALYVNATIAKKQALALFTITDNIILGKAMTSEQRQLGVNEMIELALELAIQCEE